jgi:hypothetical protein
VIGVAQTLGQAFVAWVPGKKELLPSYNLGTNHLSSCYTQRGQVRTEIQDGVYCYVGA